MRRSKSVLSLLATCALALAASDCYATTYSYTTVSGPLGGLYGDDADGISGSTIVGVYSDSSSVFHGYLYDGSNYTTLDDPSAGIGLNDGTIPKDISGNNVVGYYIVTEPNGNNGFLYNTSTSNWTTINDPLGTTGTFFQGIDGNNIVGYYQDSSDLQHGLLYNISTSTFTTLNYPSAFTTVASGVSGNTIVGYYEDSSFHDHGFIYNISTSTYTPLNDPSASSNGTEATAISGNNIVGSYFDSSDDPHAFIYNISTSSFTTLNDPTATFGTFANGISGSSIVGGYNGPSGENGFLAVPTPEPSSVVLLGLGAIGLGATVLRRRMRTLIHRSKRVLSLMAALALALAASQSSHAETLTTLASFNGIDGANPWGDLTLSGSTLYGMTFGNYTNNDGTVFSIPVTGGTPTTLVSFSGSNGASPFGSLTLSGSTLYGMTTGGGASRNGNIFSIPVTGGTPTNLVSFNGPNGADPYGSLTLNGSTLYGTTAGGGANGYGTVFSVPLTGGSPTTLVSFNDTNGAYPEGSLTLSGSTLYGMTSGYGGGGGDLNGNIFSIPVTGGIPTNLLAFNGTNGASPEGDLTLIGSTLYGMTQYGGANGEGEIFSIPVTGGTPTFLLSFNGTNGAYPYGSLTLSANGSTLYGMTTGGGANNDGTIFSIPLTGGSPTTLLSFNGTNGQHPEGSLTLSGSTLYGMTQYGGANNDGTIFAMNLATPEPSSVVLLGLGAIGLGVMTLRRRMPEQVA